MDEVKAKTILLQRIAELCRVTSNTLDNLFTYEHIAKACEVSQAQLYAHKLREISHEINLSAKVD